MSLAKNLQRGLKKEMNFHAAWMPVANSFRVGTYGLVEGGVLRPLGHITDDFGVDIGELETGNTTTLDFESKGVTTIRAVAGAEVPAFPDVGSLDAELTFLFSDSDSVVLKTPTLDYRSMPSVQKVANQIAKLDEWSRSFRVVSGVYEAGNSVVLLASEANTKITFDGKVSALEQILRGNGKVDFEFSVSSEKSFRSIGKQGVIGLSLFRLGWFDRVKLLAEGKDADIDEGANWTELEEDI